MFEQDRYSLSWDSIVMDKSVTMSARLEQIDRIRAEELLGKQLDNQRPLYRALVERLKQAMFNDEYIDAIINPIFISEDGYTMDAQHRLTAVSESGIPAMFLVVRGLPKEAFVYLDQNKTRASKDAFKVQGIRNTKNTSAVTTLLYQLVNGKKNSPRNEVALRMVQDNPGIEDAVTKADKLSKKINVSISATAAIYFLHSVSYPEESTNFYDLLLYGDKELKNRQHPVRRLQSKLDKLWNDGDIDGPNSSFGRDYHYIRYKALGLIHQAFQAFKDNKYKFSWDSDSQYQEVERLAKDVVSIRHSYKKER